MVAVKGKTEVEAAQSGTFPVKVLSRKRKKMLNSLTPSSLGIERPATRFDHTTKIVPRRRATPRFSLQAPEWRGADSTGISEGVSQQISV